MSVRRAIWRATGWTEANLLPGAVTVCFTALLAKGALASWGWTATLTVLALTLLLATRIWRLLRRFRPENVDAPGGRAEILQTELLLLCGVFLLLQLTGSVNSPLYPVVYLLLVVVGGFDASLINRLTFTTLAVVFELTAWLKSVPVPPEVVLTHLAAILGFPFVVRLLERAWTASERKRREAEIQKRLGQADQAAREYRLIGMTRTEPQEGIPAEQRRRDLQRSSVQQLGLGVRNVLDVLEAALKPHTVAAYWLSVDESTITLMDAITASEIRLRDNLDAGEGILGAILKNRKTVSRNHLRGAERLITYYADKVPLQAFMGVPMLEAREGQPDGPRDLRGVLLVDRKADLPFGPDEERLLQVACGEILRIWKTEQQLNRMDEIRNEAKGLYDATEGLIKTVTLQEVVEDVVDSLRRIYPASDFAAVVLEENHGKSLVIKAVSAHERFGAWKAENLGREIRRQNHLCALALKKGRIFPDTDFDKRSRNQRRIFGEKQDPPGLRSVKVAPLKLASPEVTNIGVLVVGGTSASLFPERGSRVEEVKRTLDTISNIAAISIQNAKRFEQLEELATTDPLTGLHNRRRFFEMMDEAVAESNRYERPLSLIMTDIDHFKRINDTYGHPMGDEVLKRVARVLNELARSTDRVCRVGGEEFTIIMPETDHQGGVNLAERFRSEIRKQEFQYDGQTFSVSLSLGICTMPDCARHEQELFHRADQALYHAKNHGRDQTVHYADLAKSPGPEKPT